MTHGNHCREPEAQQPQRRPGLRNRQNIDGPGGGGAGAEEKDGDGKSEFIHIVGMRRPAPSMVRPG